MRVFSRYRGLLWVGLGAGVLLCGGPGFALPDAGAQTGHPVATRRAMPPADRKALQAAIEAYDAGRLEVAEPELQRLVKSYPRNYEATEALGSLYAEAGRNAEALPLLRAAGALAPREALAQANLGAVELSLGQNAAAVTDLRRAVALAPVDGKTQANLGRALLLTGASTEAAEAFQRALKSSPGDADLTYNLALAEERAGQTAAALATVRSLPEAARNDQSLLLAGDLEERTGHPEAALADLQAAARMNPNDANLYALTVELLRHWTWGAAIQVAEFGAQRYPESEHFKVASGIAHYGDNDYKGAVPIFAALLAKDPENATVADLLGRSCSLLAEGENTGCEAVYSYAMRHPGNAVMTTYAAIAILHRPRETQDLSEADRLLGQAIQADPRYAPAYFQRGVLDQIQLHWKESAAALEQAIALQPTLPEAHYRLSRAYAHLGRREDAEAQLALQQSYAKQQKAVLDARLQEVVTFLLAPK